MKVLLTLALLCCLPAFGALPYDVADLKAKRDKKIDEINRIYAEELNKLMVKYTKAGNLKAALAIQAEMDALAGAEPDPQKAPDTKAEVAGNEREKEKEKPETVKKPEEPEKPAKPEKLSSGDEALRAKLVGTSWKHAEKGWVMTLRPDGLAGKSWGGNEPKSEVRDGVLRLDDGANFVPDRSVETMKARGGRKDGMWTLLK